MGSPVLKSQPLCLHDKYFISFFILRVQNYFIFCSKHATRQSKSDYQILLFPCPALWLDLIQSIYISIHVYIDFFYFRYKHYIRILERQPTCTSICLGLSMNFSINILSSPKLDAASCEERRNAVRASSSFQAILIPLPPPPAEALIITG